MARPSPWILRPCRGAVGVALALAAVFPMATRSAQAQTFSLLHMFGASFGVADGESPVAGLVQDAAGNLYGTTQYGGISACTGGGLGCGTVFKLDPAGMESILYFFSGQADGANPAAGLILDAAGNLYGTTTSGGTSGSGVVFKLDTSGKETVLYSFTGAPGGAFPTGNLVRDAGGNLYGTTAGGGTSGAGTLFRLDAGGTLTVLYSFTGQADGGYPGAGLVTDPAGNFYGTTGEGGVTSGVCGNVNPPGCGVVFKVDAFSNETVLHSFTGPPDGIVPEAALIWDAAGNLYGTTQWGGGTGFVCANFFPGCGVVFKINPSGQETVLYGFTGQADGANPAAGLTLDATGNLYGTTTQGGISVSGGVCVSGCGVAFKLDPSGTETVLHSFTGPPDGQDLEAGLLLDASGNLYGTTKYGGAGGGTVFKINPLGPATFPVTVALAGNGSGTVTSDPPGMDCPFMCTGFFAAGTMVTITARADAGYAFSGWSGACSGTGTCKLTTTNSAEAMTATFIVDFFSLSAAALTPGSVLPGAASNSTVNVAGAAGFNGVIALSCSVLPVPALAPTCSISPSSTTPGNPATLTVSTAGTTAGAALFRGGSGLLCAFGLPLLGLIWAGFGSGHKRRAKGAMLSCVLCFGLGFHVGCGGGSNHMSGDSSTPAGLYTITVTGTGTDTDGTLTHFTTVTLKVQ